MAKGQKEVKLIVASVLAFERKLDPSDALLYSGSWENKGDFNKFTKIKLREKAVRGTISNRPKSGGDLDPAKLDAEIQKPNLQRVDVATLPINADTLCLQFTLRILSGVDCPNACNILDYKNKLQQTINKYVTENGYDELAKRYANNIANGRFLWRNRLCAEEIVVHVKQLSSGKIVKDWTFDALNFDLKKFDLISPEIKELGTVIANGLAGKSYALLEITAYSRMGKGLEVFPSQELVLDKGNKKGQKSKILYSCEDAAGIHSQKIGNALRTIDDWYPGDTIGPIAIEPYGSVTALGKAFRTPTDKQDFYTLLDKWVINDGDLKVSEQHYVIANLIRGGVFGKSEDKSDK